MRDHRKSSMDTLMTFSILNASVQAYHEICTTSLLSSVQATLDILYTSHLSLV